MPLHYKFTSPTFVRLTERDFNQTVTAFPKLEAGSNKLNSMQKLFDIT